LDYKKLYKLDKLKIDRGIGMAEKITKQEGITGVVIYTTNPYFDSTAYARACKMK